MSYNHVSMDERRIIHRMKFLGHSNAEVARCLGRHRCTIGRELKRCRTWDGRYCPGTADAYAHARRMMMHRRSPVTGDAGLMGYVADRLEHRWSPDQIAGRIDKHPPQALRGRRISRMTIYRWIWGDRRRTMQFRPYLRVANKKRRNPYGTGGKRGQIPNRVGIEHRPAAVDDRGRLGDWEGDTMVGKGRTGYLLTSVERRSRFTVARYLPRATAAAVTAGLVAAMGRLPRNRRATLTVDNGKEFAAHQDIARRLRLGVYFAHPYSAWERGTNENTNGLLRQYLPKKLPFTDLTGTQVAAYVRELNNRPRKCLNYRTPAEVFW